MREIRVSKMSEPQKVASSALYILEAGEDVEIIALGLAANVLIKACALVNNLKNHELSLVYTPFLEHITDSFGEVRSAVKMRIEILK